MSVTPLLATAAEGEALGGVNHWVVGGVILLILMLVMAGLLAFGAGRDHT
jgi:hypothetical protein